MFAGVFEGVAADDTKLSAESISKVGQSIDGVGKLVPIMQWCIYHGSGVFRRVYRAYVGRKGC